MRDEQRSSALLLWPHEPARRGGNGRGPRPFRRDGAPAAPVRILQALAVKRGWIGWDSNVVAPLMEARRGELGEAAKGEPRVLVRVDEFPHARAFDSAGCLGTERFKRFHALLAEGGVPYLLAVSPRVSRNYLDPAVDESRPLDEDEVELLQALRREGVTFALHGLDHRTRYGSPRRRSELCGLSAAAASERIDTALAILAELDLQTPIFVPPFNRFAASQYRLLAERFAVVCGGPETVRLFGFAPTPAWRDDAVYLPSYPPLYGRSAEVEVEVERLAGLGAALWAPVTLHWGWEADDDFASLRRLCRALAGRAVDWADFLDAVSASRRVT